MGLRQALGRSGHRLRWHTAPGVKVRLSLSTLTQRYYYWLRAGKTVECLALRYISKLEPVPPEVVYAFVSACSAAGVRSLSGAFRRIDARFSRRRILAALPDQVFRMIRDNFAARRQARQEARQLLVAYKRKLEDGTRAAERWFDRESRRSVAAEAARGRRVRKRLEGLYSVRTGERSPDTSGRREASLQRAGAIFKAVPQGVMK